MDAVSAYPEKLRTNAEYGKVNRPRIVIRDTADADVIRKALTYYLAQRKVMFHRAAATADDEGTLRLSLDYESDKEYVCGLLRAVGDGTMRAEPDTGDTESKDNDNE